MECEGHEYTSHASHVKHSRCYIHVTSASVLIYYAFCYTEIIGILCGSQNKQLFL